ncbi:BSD domain-containing protein 1-B [Rhypophila sp. PSN 637]
MDVAYDHIQEEVLQSDNNNASSSGDKKPEAQQPTLNAEFQDAYRAFSSSPWGARIGGFLGSVVKQGESVYQEAQKELSAVSVDATRGFSDLRTSIINRTRALSLNTSAPPAATATEGGEASETTPTRSRANPSDESSQEQSETVLSRLREEAAKRLKDLQKAEDAADEALLRFGSNLRDFLKDAIKIAPPTEGSSEQGGSNTVLFESKDAHGKRVIHTSRFDAQLHVIHTTSENFIKDGAGEEYDAWTEGFDLDKKTEDISADLAKYPELRTTMEKLVPDQVPYADFWKRYYFLRHGIETAEARRRDLLKAASAEEEVGWDEDSEDEEEEESAPPKEKTTTTARPSSTGSSTTIQPAAAAAAAASSNAAAQPGLLKPAEAQPRKSNDEKSQADSDTSYDMVGAASGVPSRAPNSPRMSRKDESSEEEESSSEEEDSDEEDWE